MAMFPKESPPPYSNPAFSSSPPVDPEWKEKPSKRSCYRIGIILCSIACFIVLLINIAVTAHGLHRYGTDPNGIGTIFSGNCSRTKIVNTILHLIINSLSTVLLGATNYCMQCICAPTRSQVDAAHSVRRYVDIGVMRLSNLSHVDTGRIFIWGLLALSSVPLHLMWNSAVFSSVGVWQYDVYSVPERLLDDFYESQGSGFQGLEVEECLRVYMVQLLTDRSTLAVVTNGTGDITGPESFGEIDFLYHQQPFKKFCFSFGIGNYGDLDSGGCNYNAVLKKYREDGVWRYGKYIDGEEYKWDGGGAVQYCQSKKREEVCSLRFSRTIMIVVIICNAIKLGCLVWFLMTLKEEPLITIGDAIASFMKERDQHTRGLGIVSAGDVKKRWSGDYSQLQHTSRKRWYAAVGLRQFILAYIPPILGLIVAVCFLILGLNTLRVSNINLASLAFGSVDIRALAMLNPDVYTHKYNLVSLAIIANTPQLILSVSYFMYNRIYTSMLLSDELSSYSIREKGLRVSRPRGYQRSNYFLSLPYRWSVPLAVASLLLHWLFSQSFFVVNIDLLDRDSSSRSRHREADSLSVWDCGYSPMAIVCSLAVSGVLLLAGVAVAFGRRFEGDMPLAGSNSAAISAACHRPEGEDEGHLRKVMWGEVLETADKMEGHCTFTSRGTVRIRQGRQYY